MRPQINANGWPRGSCAWLLEGFDSLVVGRHSHGLMRRDAVLLCSKVLMSGDALWGTSNARFEAAQALPESLRDVVLLPLHRLTHGTYFLPF
jgi:hypothetical protein